jgi:hypothetical protein
MNDYNYVDALNGTGAFGGAAAQAPLTPASRYGLRRHSRSRGSSVSQFGSCSESLE